MVFGVFCPPPNGKIRYLSQGIWRFSHQTCGFEPSTYGKGRDLLFLSGIPFGVVVETVQCENLYLVNICKHDIIFILAFQLIKTVAILACNRMKIA